MSMLPITVYSFTALQFAVVLTNFLMYISILQLTVYSFIQCKHVQLITLLEQGPAAGGSGVLQGILPVILQEPSPHLQSQTEGR